MFTRNLANVYDSLQYMAVLLKTPVAVVIGGANVDIQGISEARLAAHDSNPGRISVTCGGVGRNIAENLARLGFSTTLITAFGLDPDGDFLRRDCAVKGIGIEYSLLSRAPTPRYVCVMDRDGTLAAAVADMEAIDLLDAGFLESRRAVLEAADYLVVDANIPESALAWIAANFGRNGRMRRGKKGPRLFADPVSMAKAPRLAGVLGDFDCAKPNRAEAGIIAGVASGSPEELRKELALRSALPESLYMSLAGEGMYFWTKEKGEGIVRLPPLDRRPAAVSGSGAGDAICAALVHADYLGLSPLECARTGLAAAILTVAGAETVSPRMGAETLAAFTHELYGEEVGA